MSSFPRAAAAHRGLLESRHPGVAGHCSAYDVDRQRRPRRLAETHIEVEQGPFSQSPDEIAMCRFRRQMGDQAMVEQRRIDGVQHRRGRRTGLAVEQNRQARHPCRNHRTGDGGDLLAAEATQDV